MGEGELSLNPGPREGGKDRQGRSAGSRAVGRSAHHHKVGVCGVGGSGASGLEPAVPLPPQGWPPAVGRASWVIPGESQASLARSLFSVTGPSCEGHHVGQGSVKWYTKGLEGIWLQSCTSHFLESNGGEF